MSIGIFADMVLEIISKEGINRDRFMEYESGEWQNTSLLIPPAREIRKELNMP